MFEYFKKELPNNKKTKKYLDSCKSIYVVCCWAQPLMLEAKWSGKFNKDNQPLVWIYDDHNGTCDNYFLRSVTSITSGGIYNWYFDKQLAKERLAAEQEKFNQSYQYFDRIVDEEFKCRENYDRMIIDWVKPTTIRISWFKEGHFQDELYLDLTDKKYIKTMPPIDWYPVGRSYDLEIYFSQNQQFMSIDFYDKDNDKCVINTYDINELFAASY